MTSRLRNPFKPTAGATPPLLVGRGDVLEEFTESLEDGPGAPMRLVRFTGARGVGKTVMLTEVADVASRRGWAVISDTATPGLAARLAATVAQSLTKRGIERTRSDQPVDIAPVSDAPQSTSRSALAPQAAVDFRANLGLLLNDLEAHDSGLLITVDEVHSTGLADLRELAPVFQHLTREKRDIALAMAGLPSAVSDLLNDHVLTFLRRAVPVELADVPLTDVREAFTASFAAAGRQIEGQALDIATAATGGYPFMIQLVGYHVWRCADGEGVSADAAERGATAARKRLGSTVHETSMADLSGVDRTYLVAMAQDDGPSSTGTIARRLNETPQYAGVYRQRLIDAGMIEAVDHGKVDFAIPYLREYLREHAARYEMESRTT